MSKYGYLRQVLAERGLVGPGRALSPAPASEAVLALAHDAGYVRRVLTGRLAAQELRRIGLPGTAKVARRARLAAAGTALATWMALEHGIAANAAGGSHHAGPEGGAGFCTFNDVAVAAMMALARGGPSPILVVDCDVHQGDGTARIFAARPEVFTLSVHAERNYPAEKARSDLDIALPDGTGDDAYLGALGDALEAAIERVRPRLAYYNAGVDVWEGDRLGRLSLSARGIRRRDRLVISRLRAAGVPVVCVVGGGYDHDPLRLAAHHAILFEEAAAAA